MSAAHWDPRKPLPVRRHSKGWHVQLKRAGRRWQKYFADSNYGGKSQARQEAVAWRDKLFRRLPPATKTKRTFAPNKTGVIGVHLHRVVCRGRELESYVARWTDGRGGIHTASFSVQLYGLAEAFRRAVAARNRGLRERLGRHAAPWLQGEASPRRKPGPPRIRQPNSPHGTPR